MTISRATLIATADDPDSRLAVRAWLETHRRSLGFVSDNLGCGCCVDLWDIEGDAAVLTSIPSHLLASSAWADGDDG